MAHKEYDILISYRRIDAQFAERLAQELHKSGVRVWFDKWNISPGEMFAIAFQKGVLEADAVGVCIGPKGDESLPTDPVALLQDSRKQNPAQIVLPILVRGAEPADIPSELGTFNFTEGSKTDTEKLVYKLAEALVSVGEFPAATYLFQALVVPPKKSLLDGLKNLVGKQTQTEPEPPSKFELPLISLANQILRGIVAQPVELLRLATRLKAAKQFSHARRILARASLDPAISEDSRTRLLIYQQLALCTYKDPDLPVDARLDSALDILKRIESLSETVNQETLGLAGAIYKRKWEVDNQKQQLERSLNYYRRGTEQGCVHDQGYTGINAAFVLDLLARQEEEEAKKAQVYSEVATRRRAEAKEIRTEIVRKVAPLVDQADTNWLQGKWWFYSTVAEAHFGLGSYDEAVDWLNRGLKEAANRKAAIAPWEYESTARQLAHLARIQDTTKNTSEAEGVAQTKEALAALKRFFSKHEVDSAYTGKFGLALSGGGFRAALFHLGVLARLAELDVLHRIEVLSCVSGGSIIGAHYYLEVRKLLQTVPDEEINRQHYIDIVARVRKDFLEGVQKNVRMRVAAEFTTNLKMIFWPRYTRTMRAGELYESEIFSRVPDAHKDYPRMDLRERDDPRWLNGLYVCPITADGKPDQDFNFKTDNWRRRAKVPNLILNTAALNTGHNWQFTASWMGEPPAGIDSQIDGNDRLRRLYYNSEDTPKTHRAVRLGHAVGASSCVQMKARDNPT